MNASRVAAWLLAAAVCGAWLASAAGISRYTPVSRPPVAPVPDLELNTLAADVQTQAGRLRSRLTNAPAPAALERNPFSFDRPRYAPRPAPAPAVRLEPPVEEPLVSPEPALRLIGMAENKIEGGVARTAMIADDMDGLIMAARGQQILGRYEVVEIGADAVELKDLQTGATRRLVLR